MADTNPYSPLGQQRIEGHAFVIRKLRDNSPSVYFVKDYRHKPPRQYWSPLSSLAFRFGCMAEAHEFARFLDSKPNAEQGITEIAPVLHRETVKPTVAVPAVRDANDKSMPQDREGFLSWLTTYSGVTGKSKKQEPVKPAPRNHYSAESDSILRTSPRHSWRSEQT